MRFPVALLLVVGLYGCKTDRAETICERTCNELVKVCQFGAFPDWTSCVQGCTYDEEQGADVVGYETCVTDASCDTFAILECEHDYGYSE